MPKFQYFLNRDHVVEDNGMARLGLLQTAHGDIHTPTFMPVGTCATVKCLKNETIKATGAEIILGNTYHLMLRPTAEIIAELGGLHKFMDWDRPILTDSGGFQVMSLSKINKITEEGALFYSHLDGSRHLLSPERSMDIQHKLDSNITMALDECLRQPADYRKTKRSMELTLRWAARSRKAFVEREGYGIFGIVQGGIIEDLRRQCAKELVDMQFHGYAIGGDLAIDGGQAVMFNALQYLTPLLPDDRPRYLMGVGKPEDIVGSVLRGVDMFDCVMPARSGRNGQAFVRGGSINIRNAQYTLDTRPLDEKCQCTACRNHTRAYLHHLFKAHEILGGMLLTEHNITYYQDLMRNIRRAIGQHDYKRFAENFMAHKTMLDE